MWEADPSYESQHNWAKKTMDAEDLATPSCDHSYSICRSICCHDILSYSPGPYIPDSSLYVRTEVSGWVKHFGVLTIGPNLLTSAASWFKVPLAQVRPVSGLLYCVLQSAIPDIRKALAGVLLSDYEQFSIDLIAPAHREEV